MTENDMPQNGPPSPPPPPPAAPEPPPPPPATQPAGGQSGNRNVMIVLSYLWLLCLIPLLTEKEDQEVQWHAKHGLVLLVAEIILWIAVGIVGFLLGLVTSGLGCLFTLLYPLLSLAVIVVHVVAIVKGVNGERFLIPGISDFVSKF